MTVETIIHSSQHQEHRRRLSSDLLTLLQFTSEDAVTVAQVEAAVDAVAAVWARVAVDKYRNDCEDYMDPMPVISGQEPVPATEVFPVSSKRQAGKIHVNLVDCPTFLDRIVEDIIGSEHTRNRLRDYVLGVSIGRDTLPDIAEIYAKPMVKNQQFRHVGSWWDLLPRANELCYRCSVGPALTYLFTDSVTTQHEKSTYVVGAWPADHKRVVTKDLSLSSPAKQRFTGAATGAGLPVRCIDTHPYVITELTDTVARCMSQMIFTRAVPDWFDHSTQAYLAMDTAAQLMVLHNGAYDQVTTLTVDPFDLARSLAEIPSRTTYANTPAIP